MADILYWGSILSVGACFAFLAYIIFHAFSEGVMSYASTYSDTAARQLEDMFLFIPPQRIGEASWACAGIAFFIFFLLLFDPGKPVFIMVGLGLGVAAGFGAFQIPRKIITVMHDKRRRKFNEQLVEALGQMSNSLKAGFSIAQSFETIVENGENPIAQEFSVFLQQMRVGISFSEALDNLERRVGSEDLELVCRAMEIARKTGGNLTEIFDKISLTIRERMRIERRVMTLTAQGRIQGWIVGSMPVVVGIAMMFFRPETMLPFLKSPGGIAAIAAVIVLITLGALCIRKIIRIDV